MSTVAKANVRILVVRLGALGDVLHALPAVASLKHSFPGCRLTWIIDPKWTALLQDNPFVDRVVLLRRDSPRTLFESWRHLREEPYDFAVDFQGLIKSALVSTFAGPKRIFGFHQTQVRERAAALFYSTRLLSPSAHVVDRNLDLAAAAGASSVLRTFPLPAGIAEGDLPPGDFVLASPFAGWRSKQWPMEHYRALAARLHTELGIPLVLNAPPGAPLEPLPNSLPHFSSLPGLIFATRRAAAVLGVDSGPMHIAAALGKPGVAIFGPTDPARNGPYGDTVKILRTPGVETTYKRRGAIDESMRRISPDQVFETLRTLLGARRCLV